MKLGNSLTADDRGVSPVIGVILMVAITVILAAVIGTFVLGLGDSIGNSPTAGVSVEGAGTDEATVTLSNSGTATDVLVVANNSSDTEERVPLDSVGDRVTIGDGTDFDIDIGGNERNVDIIAVNENGDESLLRSFTVDAS